MRVGVCWAVLRCGRCGSVLLAADDADGSVAFEDGVFDLEDGVDALGAGGGHDVFGVDVHAAHDLGAPFTVFDEDEGGAIDDGSEAGRLGFGPGDEAVEHADGEDGGDAVGAGAVLADGSEDDDAADEEDDDELEEGHLGTGAAGEDADGEEEEEVSEGGVDDGLHVG